MANREHTYKGYTIRRGAFVHGASGSDRADRWYIDKDGHLRDRTGGGHKTLADAKAAIDDAIPPAGGPLMPTGGAAMATMTGMPTTALTLRVADDDHALMQLAAGAARKSLQAWMLDACRAQVLRQAHGDKAGPVAAALNKRAAKKPATDMPACPHGRSALEACGLCVTGPFRLPASKPRPQRAGKEA